jgi:hypothetical protein
LPTISASGAAGSFASYSDGCDEGSAVRSNAQSRKPASRSWAAALGPWRWCVQPTVSCAPRAALASRGWAGVAVMPSRCR